MIKSAPWGDKEKKEWLCKQSIKRSYSKEVVTKVKSLENQFSIITYGSLSFNPKRYPLYILKNINFDSSKKSILITGGVHGYETSGVQGTLEFLKTKANSYTDEFNIIAAPCISPWSYETINRWNPSAIDPNRSFYKNSPAQECTILMKAIEDMNLNIFAHFDLHETTDTDNTVFRPALEERDATPQEIWSIPDGFYLVGDSTNPCYEFQKAIIGSVQKVTHIAPEDSNGKIIGNTPSQKGVINYPVKKLNLCAGFTHATYCTTTEVYPDSPKVNDEICVQAQVAAVSGGLDFLINK